MTKIVVALHGWGGSAESWNQLREAITGKDIQLFTPELPGFGDEPEPSKPWNNDNYVDWVIDWIETNVTNNTNAPITLIGHSHGGRVSIKLTGREHVPFTIEHLVLCAAAGIRHKQYSKRGFGFVVAKTGKVLLSIPGLRSLAPFMRKQLYRLLRVHDYERASPVMQKTLQLVTNEDVRHILPNIRVPTDIFWGTEDTMTPYGDAKIMEANIPNATLHTFKDVRHAVHRAAAEEIGEIL